MDILSSHLLGIACDARDRAVKAAKASPDDTHRDATVAIILSAAAAEGFINEASELVNQMSKPGGVLPRDVTPQEAAFGQLLVDLEKGHASIKAKYLTASVLLSGRLFDQGCNPFQDFSLLIKLRDEHMHLKPKQGLRVQDGNLLPSPPSYIPGLQGRGLVRKYPENTHVPWISYVQTAEMAQWAVETARNIITAVLDMTLDTLDFKSDPFSIFKMAFRSSAERARPWDRPV
jgi:hypothetical protein